MTDFHDEISLLIPAYLRGELSPADVTRLEAAAANDPSIQADLDFQRELRITLQSERQSETADEMGWARLSRSLDGLEAKTEAPTAKTLSPVNDASPKRPKFWMGATAALAVLCAAQFAAMNTLTSDAKTEAQYVLVSESSERSQVSVTPNMEMRLQDLNTVLNSVSGQITSGPSAIGLYNIKFETKEACMEALPTLEKDMLNVTVCR